jgi:hypothetical protein
MSVQASNTFAGDSTFNPPKAATEASAELSLNAGLPSFIDMLGGTSFNHDLNASAGNVVNLYDVNKIVASGNSGDGDRYSTAVRQNANSRTMQINLLWQSLKEDKEGTMAAQVRSFDINSKAISSMLEWMKSTVTHSYINHLSGNTATTLSTINAGNLTDSADILRFTGFNAPVALPASRRFIGSLGAGSVTADEGVTSSSNKLIMQDFEAFDATIGNVGATERNFDCFDGSQGYQYAALVPASSWHDLTRETTGLNIRDTYYNTLAGGKTMMMKTAGYAKNSVIINGWLLIKVADALLARGINSSSGAPVANTRKVVIFGRNALDVAFGKGFSTGNKETDKSMDGTEVTLDDSEKKLNKQMFLSIERLWGCKRADYQGQGANSSNIFPNSATITVFTGR